ncbi:SMP-30/Gluconolaconase/LRE-like region [Penicillium manginii]|uniref:SMP-30/Gluconolaconase/LRE-like region n=1 Tax=Penicillium manginii TaxID=203109 RepID=UPI002547F8D5|nr:SMP-30/Gluconolaconase/LRE-like region [Penicillium manginii]KAJ5755664.1 SMP-30/Gluconolaconase/LRE-like region [Penicillium manginii]
MASLTHSAVSANATHIPSAFSIYNNDFLNIIGSAPKLEVILENNDYPFAHEASVYIPSSDSLFVSSNMYTDPVTNEKTIKITKVNVNAHPVTSEILNSTIPMPNGGVNHDGGILWAAQGTMNETGGNFYGRQFNSLNDVVVANDGSLWFTDPIYAYKQGVRPKPKLPNQVYRYDPSTKDVRVVADGFGRPNGISFSPDEKTVYISDTAETIGDGSKDLTQPATIYAFDVTAIHDQPFLTNRRVFAMPGDGIPDGIKVDQDGNVYAGCGDGVNVWSAGGVLLGKILVKDGTSNFSFGRNGQMFILNENKIYRAQLNRKVHGTLF